MHTIIPVILLGCAMLNPTQAAEPTRDAVAPQAPLKTAKERLSDKASDEQRTHPRKAAYRASAGSVLDLTGVFLLGRQRPLA